MSETWRQKNAQKNRRTSSFYGSSRKFQSNPSSNPTPSNPNPNPRTANSSSTAPNQLKITNRLQVEEEEEEEEEEDSCEPVSIIGTCPFMCPDGERVQRERLRDLAIFERLDGNPARTSPELAVKKFCRTISTKETRASDLRPLPVLEDTLKYLLNLMDSTKRPFEEVHDFIFDRTRSLRQDLSIQNIGDDRAIWMYEEMVKFHIISQHKLQTCNDNPNISSMRYLNREQLIKSLMSLLNLYEANQRPDFEHENEAEYYSFYVLLHLSSISQPSGESLSLWFRNVPFNIVKSQHMCFARRVLRLLRMGNYKQFLCAVVTEATYLQYYILEPYINEVRALALSYINNACYKLHPYPLAHLSTVLMMKDSDLESLCNSCGLDIYTDEEGIKFLPPKQTSFRYPKEGFQKYYCLALDRHEGKIPAWGN